MEPGNDGGRPKDLGGSIRVANVQALAGSAKNLEAEILHRYLRPEINGDALDDGDSEDIPIIDMSRLRDPLFEQEETSRLKFACEEWGFFQLVNHGIPDKVIEKMRADVEEFFQLPPGEKEAIAQLPGDLEGYGQAFVVSDEQKLDWGDMLFLFTQPPHFRNLRLWPAQPPTFRDTMDRYSLELKRVAHCLLGLMAKNLGLDPEKFVTIFKESQSMRINYYPPCPQADKVLGLSPHSDAVGLTLLLQVNQVQGLQIKRNGGWLPIKALPGAFVVNIGDVIEILSNGKYKSIEHRAIINKEKERLSIAAFHSPNMTTLVGPLPELVKGSKEYYKTLSFEDFVKHTFTSKLDGKSVIDWMKLKP
ncbi:S-norcoclaurine synthase 1-like [Phoenix dactylifera]|uniref:S-norcoclaurine synthase 1-like n=1 Tax=Phoenix dactylifera TaxID=42345 RepID=A0A8B7BT10_PHODC|nr:S-norcoclaurine synthase 1-like [Phoenix dactylifera]